MIAFLFGLVHCYKIFFIVICKVLVDDTIWPYLKVFVDQRPVIVL